MGRSWLPHSELAYKSLVGGCKVCLMFYRSFMPRYLDYIDKGALRRFNGNPYFGLSQKSMKREETLSLSQPHSIPLIIYLLLPVVCLALFLHPLFPPLYSLSCISLFLSLSLPPSLSRSLYVSPSLHSFCFHHSHLPVTAPLPPSSPLCGAYCVYVSRLTVPWPQIIGVEDFTVIQSHGDDSLLPTHLHPKLHPNLYILHSF